jgi:predicted ATP-dependent endonuclease of OLD family
MKLESIAIRNFRAIESLDLTFKDDLVSGNPFRGGI